MEGADANTARPASMEISDLGELAYTDKKKIVGLKVVVLDIDQAPDRASGWPAPSEALRAARLKLMWLLGPSLNRTP